MSFFVCYFLLGIAFLFIYCVGFFKSCDPSSFPVCTYSPLLFASISLLWVRSMIMSFSFLSDMIITRCKSLWSRTFPFASSCSVQHYCDFSLFFLQRTQWCKYNIPVMNPNKNEHFEGFFKISQPYTT